MKKIILAGALLFGIVISSQKAQAQVRVGLNINVGSQPVWGPVGYDYAEYYYLPDIDVYYNVPRRQFVYFSNNQWVFAGALPPRYRGYDLYSGYKVVLNEPRPYLHADIYRSRYAPYRGRHDQVIIRNSHDSRFHHDNGNHYGWHRHENERDSDHRHHHH